MSPDAPGDEPRTFPDTEHQDHLIAYMIARAYGRQDPPEQPDRDPDPAPTATGYASWDETLTLRETLQAIENTMDDYDQHAAQQGRLLGNIIQEFRGDIARLALRLDRVETALAAAGRLPPLEPTQTTLFPEAEE